MITSNHLLLEARSLLENAHLEQRRRSAMSRAYYAAFHAVKGHVCAKEIAREIAYRQADAEKKGNRPPGGHSLLINALCASGDKQLSYIGSQLSILYERRVVADYKLYKDVGLDVAEDTVHTAEELIEGTLLELDAA